MTVFPELREFSKRMRKNKHSIWSLRNRLKLGRNLLYYMLSDMCSSFIRILRCLRRKLCMHLSANYRLFIPVPFTLFPQQRRQPCLLDNLFPSFEHIVCWQLVFQTPECLQCKVLALQTCKRNVVSPTWIHLLFCAVIVKPEWPFLLVSRLSAICDVCQPIAVLEDELNWRQEVTFSFSSDLPP